MHYVSFAAACNFLLYLALSCGLLAIFTRIYIWTTPYHEPDEIRAGKKAPAIALVGAMLGFTMPLVSMSYHGVNVIDFLIWSIIAMIIQLLLFKMLYRIIPAQIEADNQAVGIVFAGASICVGLMAAFSLIPQ